MQGWARNWFITKFNVTSLRLHCVIDTLVHCTLGLVICLKIKLEDSHLNFTKLHSVFKICICIHDYSFYKSNVFFCGNRFSPTILGEARNIYTHVCVYMSLVKPSADPKRVMQQYARLYFILYKSILYYTFWGERNFQCMSYMLRIQLKKIIFLLAIKDLYIKILVYIYVIFCPFFSVGS